MRDLKKFFRANPQVLVLLIICVVLGLGTFLAVVFGLISAGGSTPNGEPRGGWADRAGGATPDLSWRCGERTQLLLRVG